MKNRTTLLVSFALCALVIGLLAGVLGYHLGKTATGNTSADGQHLLITVDADPDAPAITYSAHELSDRVDSSIKYSGVTNVSIQIDGETMKLEDAIRESRITVDEICAYARMDAANGICHENFITDHSLAQFIYRYDAFELVIVYDVYSTPDGKQHLFKSLTIFEPDGHRSSSPFYVDDTAKYPMNLDREDWGLALTPTDVAATQLTIQTSQSGGQQFGELSISEYEIYSLDTGNRIIIQNDYWSPEGFEPIRILMDGSSSFTIDWNEVVGELPAGTYLLKLWIYDIYDPSTIHPLADNFHDHQCYYIEFTIP